jgi:hypothetical protein
VTIVCHNLAYVLPVGLVTFILIGSETSRATAFDYYDGVFVFVFWIK